MDLALEHCLPFYIGIAILFVQAFIPTGVVAEIRKGGILAILKRDKTEIDT